MIVRATLLASALRTAAPAPGETPVDPVVDAPPTAEPDVGAEPDPAPETEPTPETEPKPQPEPQPAPEPKPATESKPAAPASKKPVLGGYAEFDTQLGRLDSVFATILGGSAALTIDERFIVGGSGYGMVYHDRTYPSYDGERALELAYGGVLAGVFAAHTPRVQSAFTVMLGGGRSCLRFTSQNKNCDTSANLFVSQLELGVYLKASSFARLGFALGYRFVGAAEHWGGPGNWALAGGYGAFKLAFGKF